MLSGKTVLIGITGGIAAYKIPELIRMFKKNGADVKTIVTQNALEFVTETTLKSLSNNDVAISQFETKDFKPEHIALTKEADIFLIAPATANTLSKIANGICDNLLTSVACAFQKPIILAPCMNTGMWENDAVQENIKHLKSRGVVVLEPESGFLACGDEGKGRLPQLEVIFDSVKSLLLPKQFLKGKKIVITSGGTKEEIDSVRYIGNYSSGKMGLSLAKSAQKSGGDVTLITTVENQDFKGKTILVKSADEMLEATDKEFKNADILIMAAAVSDYRVKNRSNEKIKKTGESIILELIENPDILKTISANKRDNQTVIGFCAESENLIENAKKKIDTKKCDYIIANDISDKSIGFSSDYNEVYIIDREKNIVKIDKSLKSEIADKIFERIFDEN